MEPGAPRPGDWFKFTALVETEGPTMSDTELAALVEETQTSRQRIGHRWLTEICTACVDVSRRSLYGAAVVRWSTSSSSDSRRDLRENQPSKVMEDAVVKTVAGFLNTDGGTVLIGVGPDRQVLGLTYDYPRVKQPNADGFVKLADHSPHQRDGPRRRHAHPGEDRLSRRPPDLPAGRRPLVPVCLDEDRQASAGLLRADEQLDARAA